MNAISSDVVIIGGGIMGTSAAFFLSRCGRSVTLLESGLLGQQASGTNFGNTRRQGRRLDQLPLANRASRIWQNSKQLLGIDIKYIESGHLRVCYRDCPETADAFEQYARDAKQLGLELEVLRGASLRKRFPFLGSSVLAGSYSARDGHANPRLVSPAFGRAAVSLGARVFENTPVVAVEKEGEDFRITSKDGQIFRAPVLLIAAGAWSDKLAAKFGDVAPLTSFAPTMSVTEPVTYSILPSVGITTSKKIEDVYFRQTSRGNVIIGGSTRANAYPDIRRAYVMPQNTLNQLQQICRLAPALSRLKIIRVWSGVEGYLPDSQPVIGPSEHVSGLYYAFGFAGAGFQIGPGVGETLAELIDTGSTDISLDPYQINRFNSVKVEAV
jgi:sarcosine oxidase subunit beta